MRTNQLVSLSVVLGLIAVAFGLLGNGATSKVGAPDVAGPSHAPTDWPRGDKIVDLTHAFDEQTIPWPTEIGFRLERGFDGVTDGGWYYRANRFSMAEHSGTHLDAPNHFSKDGESADDVPLARLIGPAVVIDVTAQCAQDADFQIPTEVFQTWEREHGRSLADMIVVLNTGWARFWPDKERYLGTAETGKPAVAKLHFPGLAPDAAAWLAANRKIRAVGIDTASIDAGQNKTFGTHVVLCGHGIPAFENLTNLDQLPAAGFTLIALPMKIRTGSGGPLRAVAVLPDVATAK